MSAAARSPTAGELVARAAERLGAAVRLGPASETPRLDAELLLSHCAGIGRAALFADPGRPVDADAAGRFASAVARRLRGEPLAYLTGQREFWSLALAVDGRVLVPRPETELLVEQALAAIAGSWTPMTPAVPAVRVLDLGTGSGAIALAIKSERPELALTAVDCAAPAIALAEENARRLGLEVRFVLSDWFDALAGERFDVIVANPPYVRALDPHFVGPLGFEPRLALDGGDDGLDAYRAILGGAAGHLSPGGSIWLEHGYDQREALLALAAANGLRSIGVADDLAGLPRVAGFTVDDDD